MQASIEIQGAGSTPFDANNQNLVINAFASAMTTVTRADFLVRYYTSDDSKIPTFGTSSSSGRKLLVRPEISLFYIALDLHGLNVSELHCTPDQLQQVVVPTHKEQ